MKREKQDKLKNSHQAQIVIVTLAPSMFASFSGSRVLVVVVGMDVVVVVGTSTGSMGSISQLMNLVSLILVNSCSASVSFHPQ